MRVDAVSALLLSLLALITLSVGADPTDTLSTLRVHTTADWGDTSNTVELALLYNGLIYECEVDPAEKDTDYECASFDISQSNLANDQNGVLRVTNNDNNAVMFSLMEMTTASGDSYGITGICIDDDATIGTNYGTHAADGGVCPSDSTHYDRLGVDDHDQWSPPTQFVYFNLELPNQFIDDAEWSATVIIATAAPTAQPSTSPSKEPTSSPSVSPSSEPTASPSTAVPTESPSADPTREPTASPTLDGCDFDIDAYLDECYCDGTLARFNVDSARVRFASEEMSAPMPTAMTSDSYGVLSILTVLSITLNVAVLTMLYFLAQSVKRLTMAQTTTSKVKFDSEMDALVSVSN